ncbi:TPA: hypothetical protein ACK3Q6_002685 [Burkholderia cepacia]|uniref:hypothetical protein n=1 Tax=Burkholderia cepacia TaxID=292 RepID=UPI001CF3AEC5|nr:hypothetical protein [Burkholderia cepacia]HDR9764257.1 hypothetical protein [Burkholderia cepacia ATCC 25416]MCA8361206.1 hypothetical protein [Burkholderia cepacia]HDR9769782.1 hypothetical protein [Burkholderia cepacia ATCC 25416]HDR9779883.1 hypothetical protein [Burkholderia cepacia ATCC 25416]HDR9785836.1 hypothetical protein [Burkholderia cepacia ATCC 25416]
MPIITSLLDKILEGRAQKKLHIEYIPYTMHFKNARAVMSSAEWENFCSITHKKNNWRCVECGAKGRLECHERWYYDFTGPTLSKYAMLRSKGKPLGEMKLIGVMSLCHYCHMGKHPSVAKRNNEWNEVKAHLKRVYQLNGIQLWWKLRQARARARLQSRFDYRLDLTYFNRDSLYDKALRIFQQNHQRQFTSDERQYCKTISGNQ